MRQIAEAYVRLVLAVGRHDPAYVDAYYGPAEWQRDVEQRAASLAELSDEAERLVGQGTQVEPAGPRTRDMVFCGQPGPSRPASHVVRPQPYRRGVRRVHDAVAQPRVMLQATLDRLMACFPEVPARQLDRFAPHSLSRPAASRPYSNGP